MDTRLDRLLILLDSGSHSAIKRAAAVQLGDIVKLHPEELDNLLNKVFVYFTKKNWDTRIAAGEAVEAIAKNVPLWNPSFNCRNSTSLPKVKGVNVDKFNLTRVMQSASVMVSSVHDNESEQLTSKDIPVSQQIAEQKTALKKVFTIKGAPQDVFGTEELFDDKDLVLHSTEELSGRVYRSPLKIIEQEITAALVVDNFPIAPLKRRADNEVAELPVAKKMHLKVDMEGMEQVVKGDGEAIITKDQPQSKWPFAWFCDKLVKELFNVEWEVRQGAAIGLREIIKLHGIRAGYTNEAPIETQKLQNATWLSKLALKLVCVLALDKFGDFASDEVVAPVRETCAQTLGAAIHHMSEDNAKQILHLCLSMQQHSNWEARHGGLLGIKYLLAVKQSIVREVLPSILPSILEALKDHNDDVKAVAADTLVPVTQHLIETFPNKITSILNILWDSVKNLDDLTTSTSSIMTLLSSLSLRAVKAGCLSLQPFHQLVPSLWPPMSHTVASVREAALDTLRTLLESNDIDGEPPVQCSWTPDIINKTLRFLYQRIILESNIKIFDMLLDVWRSFLMHCSLSDLNFSCEKSLNTWLYLLMTRQRQNIEGHVLLPTKESEPTINSFIGGCISADDPTTIENADTRARFGASRALGYLCCHIMKLNSTSLSYRILNEFLMSALNTNSAVNIMCTSLVLYDWASIARKEYNSDLEKCFPRTLTNKLALLLNQEPGIYDELFTMNDSMQTGAKAVAIHLVRAGFRDRIKIPAGEFTIDEAIRLCNFAISEAKSSKEIISKVKALVPVINDLKLMMDRWRTKVESVIAGALIAWGQLTEKFNPIVRPLMDSIKKEDNQLFQMKAANSISLLLEKCINRLPCPNPKIFKNLCSLLCTDPSKTPDVSNFWILQNLLASPVTGKPSTPISPGTASPFDVSFTCNKEAGIITLFNQHKDAVLTAGTGRKSSKICNVSSPAIDLPMLNFADKDSNQVQIQRIGAERAVTTIARYFGRSLFEKLPFCSNHLMVPLMSPKDALHELDFTKYKEDAASQKIVIALQILEVLAPSIDASLHEKVLRSQYQQILHCAIFPYTAVRHLAARCLAVLATLDLVGVMDMIIKKIIPALGDTERDAFREGSIEVIANVIDKLSIGVVPYIVLLVIPVLSRMSDRCESVRQMASHSFATLIKLMPLEAGTQDPVGMDEATIKQKKNDRIFLEQLQDTSKLNSYSIPFQVKADLRKYQKDGINWLAFLNKYNLHGILCDDMGLGKTLQALCMIVSDHMTTDAKYKLDKKTECRPLPSLVICPPTVVYHWCDEVVKFCGSNLMSPLPFIGTPQERESLKKKVTSKTLVVSSYDIVRNESNFFTSRNWNYCALDEGHIIKNGKTKLSRCIKQVHAKHRLILTGTPIQNNVLELWSLFDYLMPGYLGTEKQFNVKYSKPILSSRDAKANSKEQEAGVLALESLHKQVLPFILRRMKEDVLQDLPPKIIQDYYCEMTSLQMELYANFTKSRATDELDLDLSSLEESKKEPSKMHAFQALQYLRLICNHPVLVLNEKHPQYYEITSRLSRENLELSSIQHSAKLMALKQLLLECGIGIPTTNVASVSVMPVVAQHRALVFFQSKAMMKLVEEKLFKDKDSTVAYVKLSGDVSIKERAEIVSRFNKDPSIDVMLLTTKVGGVGLNLTGADTVIFVEHDWNPMADAQAMDRAHRIGQKKVVNVYRLITRNTLEEKILGLQNFKSKIANTVISQENASLMSMGTNQIVDLFKYSTEENSIESKSKQGGESKKKENVKAILNNLSDLWDEEEYKKEFNLFKYIKNFEDKEA